MSDDLDFERTAAIWQGIEVTAGLVQISYDKLHKVDVTISGFNSKVAMIVKLEKNMAKLAVFVSEYSPRGYRLKLCRMAWKQYKQAAETARSKALFVLKNLAITNRMNEAIETAVNAFGQDEGPYDGVWLPGCNRCQAEVTGNLSQEFHILFDGELVCGFCMLAEDEPLDIRLSS